MLAWHDYSRINVEYRNFAVNRQWEHEAEMVQNLGDKPKLFHAYIRRKKKGSTPVGPLKVEGQVISHPAEMSNVFARCFASVFNPDVPNVVSEHQQCDAQMEPMWISVDDVVKALLGLKVSSAAGGEVCTLGC